MITAPFTEIQVEKLNQQQKDSRMHPYTCGGPEEVSKKYCERKQMLGKKGELIATVSGWICPCGKYKQHWSHDV